MVGHTAGSLLDDDGANALLQSAEESLAVAERLNCRRLLVFGTELGLPQLVRDGGLGLVGMRERIALLDGRLTVESEPERGTSLVAEVPVV